MSRESWGQSGGGRSDGFHRRAERYTPDPNKDYCVLHALAALTGVSGIDRRYTAVRQGHLDDVNAQVAEQGPLTVARFASVSRADYKHWIEEGQRTFHREVLRLYSTIRGDSHSELGAALRKFDIHVQRIPATEADAFVKHSRHKVILEGVLKRRDGSCAGHAFFARHVPFVGLMDANFKPWSKVTVVPQYLMYAIQFLPVGKAQSTASW